MDGVAETSPRRASDQPITFRRSTPADLQGIIDVCRSALDWEDGDLDVDYFRWKHFDNPFGSSPIWLAEDPSSGRIVGLRTMMRWELVRGGERLRLGRAVDTATLPSHQGRGIFSKLTREAVAGLESDGFDAIFNTPNDKSRPGYLKLGWVELGKAPVRVLPRSPRSIPSIVRARTAASKWGTPTDLGLSPGDALADADAVAAAIACAQQSLRWSTPLSVDYLRWRTALARLECRIQPIGSSIADGFVVFRLRTRGPMSQLSVLHVVHPPDKRPGRTLRRLVAESGADVALASGSAVGLRDRLLPLPRSGPVLTWRALCRATVPGLDDLDLDLGGLELF